MRKLLTVLLICLFIPISVTAAGNSYTLVQAPYPVMVNGQALKSIIMNYDGNTMVPLKAVLDMMGATTKWTGSSVDIQTVDVEKLKESCVEIYVSKNGADVEQGSGVLIGYNQILSSNHVTDKGNGYRAIYNSSDELKCSLKYSNASLDISILEPENKNVKPCKIGDSDEVKVGDVVILVSSPKEKKNVVEYGTIKAFPNIDGINYIQIMSYADYGSSGGAIYNIKGELIGILEIGSDDKKSVGALPINIIRKSLSN